MGVSLADHERMGGYRHEAALYASESEFLAITRQFILDGHEAGEPTLVVVSEAKIEALRGALGAAASKVQFADMNAVGANPARIIPVWREFLDRHRANGQHAVRGIGEPIDAARSPAEVVESQIHEALLNVAFADSPRFALLCPYDTAGLDAATIAEAQRRHPFVRDAISSSGGQGSHRVWHDDRVLCCEIRDAGEITNPLVGRINPPAQQAGGRGVWIANQVCDLVQVRTGSTGTVVRLHLKR